MKLAMPPENNKAKENIFIKLILLASLIVKANKAIRKIRSKILNSQKLVSFDRFSSRLIVASVFSIYTSLMVF